ncbi:UNVERIFIED_CONTAM: hypothetical protein HDU68_005413, partial [Siphonaria sp. JEL0065]
TALPTQYGTPYKSYPNAVSVAGNAVPVVEIQEFANIFSKPTRNFHQHVQNIAQDIETTSKELADMIKQEQASKNSVEAAHATLQQTDAEKKELEGLVRKMENMTADIAAVAAGKMNVAKEKQIEKDLGSSFGNLGEQSAIN